MRAHYQLCLLVGALLTASVAHAAPRDRYTWDRGRFEVGPRVTQLTLTDDATEASLPMGGVGTYFRWRFSRRLGVEGAFDAVFADEIADESPGEVTRATIPATLSAMVYLFPESRFQMYGLGGFGMTAHTVQYEALGESAEWTTPALQVGAGAQYRWNGARLDVSVRGLFMERHGEEVEAVHEAEFWEVSDRGINFEWLSPERREKLPLFYSWFDEVTL